MLQSVPHHLTRLCWLLWPDGASTSRLGLAGWRVCGETTSWWALWGSTGCQAFPVCFTVAPLFSELRPGQRSSCCSESPALRSAQKWRLQPLGPADILPFRWLGDPMSVAHSQPWMSVASRTLLFPLTFSSLSLRHPHLPWALPPGAAPSLKALSSDLTSRHTCSCLFAPLSPHSCQDILGSPVCCHLILCLSPPLLTHLNVHLCLWEIPWWLSQVPAHGGL